MELNFFRSLRPLGIPFAFKSGIARDCHDDLLVLLWVVSRLQRSPRHTLTISLIVLSIGGYFSSRVYASMGGTNRRKNAFLTATLLPT